MLRIIINVIYIYIYIFIFIFIYKFAPAMPAKSFMRSEAASAGAGPELPRGINHIEPYHRAWPSEAPSSQETDMYIYIYIYI